MGEEKQLTVKDAYQEYLEKIELDAAKVCSEFMDPRRITALLIGEAVRAPDLYECMKTPEGRLSIMNFYMLSAQVGLEPGIALGLLYAIPKTIKGKIQILPVIGYKGYCELAHRSGSIRRISANPFYKGEVEGGWLKISKEPPDIQHTYSPTVNESDENLAGVYAVVETTTGGKYVLVMSREKVLARAQRGGSYNSNYSPWKSDFAAMARKTVIRSLLSGGLVPLSSELRKALSDDGDSVTYEGHEPHTEEEPIEPPKRPAPRSKKSGAEDVRGALGIDRDRVVDADFEEVPKGSGNPFDDAPDTMT